MDPMVNEPMRCCDPADRVATPRQHDQVPANPSDGDTFRCSCCGHTAEYVELDDGKPGEWVQTSND